MRAFVDRTVGAVGECTALEFLSAGTSDLRGGVAYVGQTARAAYAAAATTSAGSLVLPPATPPEPAPLSTVVVATLVGEAERGLCEVAPGQPLAFVSPSWWYWWWAEWLEPWIA